MGVLLDPVDLLALARAAHGILSLTATECRVLKSFFRGATTDEIALEVGITRMTTQAYLKKIFSKCGSTRMLLMRLAVPLDMIPSVGRYVDAQLSGKPFQSKKRITREAIPKPEKGRGGARWRIRSSLPESVRSEPVSRARYRRRLLR